MKKFRIALLSILVLLSITFAWFYIYYWKQDCEDFIEECYSRRLGRAWGMALSFDKLKKSCPNNCIRYQEWNWYFKDKDKKEAYWSKKVKKCEEFVEQCKKEHEWVSWSLAIFDCPHCDQYWNRINLLY